jgi:hypothetical protein
VYRIRLPSGREAEFATIEELALALRRGDVSREALIYHRRTEQWVPIEQHPRFQGQIEQDEPESAAAPQPPAVMPPAAPPPPRPVEETPIPPAWAMPTPVAPAPVAPAPVAPTPPPPSPAAPLPVVPAPPEPATTPFRTHAMPPVAPTPYPVRAPARAAAPPAPPLAPRPVAADATRTTSHRDEPTAAAGRPGILRRLIRLLFFLLLVAGAYFAWQRWGGQLVDRRTSATPGFEAAPPPSTLLRETPADSAPAPAPAPAVRTARPDPRAPIAVDELIARHAATFAASRDQLAAEMTTIGFPAVFSPVSFASPLGARAARRRIASALNVIGEYQRRSVLLDQAYGDTASFQASRAGWSAAERERWDTRPSLREPYASADRAESLLADADSLLAILGNAARFELREDTVAFGDPVRAAAYDAQRRRLLERIGPPVEDFDRRPTLFLVRRSLDPTRPPAPLP